MARDPKYGGYHDIVEGQGILDKGRSRYLNVRAIAEEYQEEDIACGWYGVPEEDLLNYYAAEARYSESVDDETWTLWYALLTAIRDLQAVCSALVAESNAHHGDGGYCNGEFPCCRYQWGTIKRDKGDTDGSSIEVSYKTWKSVSQDEPEA